MDTAEIMAVALAQASLQEVPSDSGIHIAGTGLRRALFGIDIEVAVLLYAKEAGFDVVVAHHPVGGGGASVKFTEVMWRQVEQMTEEGIAEPIARAAVAERVDRVHRRRHQVNHNRVLDTARLIGLPLLNIHLPQDIVTRRFLQDLLAEKVDALTTGGRTPRGARRGARDAAVAGQPRGLDRRGGELRRSADRCRRRRHQRRLPGISDLLCGWRQDDPGDAHRRGGLPPSPCRGPG